MPIYVAHLNTSLIYFFPVWLVDLRADKNAQIKISEGEMKSDCSILIGKCFVDEVGVEEHVG